MKFTEPLFDESFLIWTKKNRKANTHRERQQFEQQHFFIAITVILPTELHIHICCVYLWISSCLTERRQYSVTQKRCQRSIYIYMYRYANNTLYGYVNTILDECGVCAWQVNCFHIYITVFLIGSWLNNSQSPNHRMQTVAALISPSW